MQKGVGWLGVAIIVCVFILAIIAYFIFSFDPRTEITYDGLGRQLYESPWLMRLIFGEDRLWAGWLWFIGDMVIFWSGIVIGFKLVRWGFKQKD